MLFVSDYLLMSSVMFARMILAKSFAMQNEVLSG